MNQQQHYMSKYRTTQGPSQEKSGIFQFHCRQSWTTMHKPETTFSTSTEERSTQIKDYAKDATKENQSLTITRNKATSCTFNAINS